MCESTIIVHVKDMDYDYDRGGTKPTIYKSVLRMSKIKFRKSQT